MRAKSDGTEGDGLVGSCVGFLPGECLQQCPEFRCIMFV